MLDEQLISLNNSYGDYFIHRIGDSTLVFETPAINEYRFNRLPKETKDRLKEHLASKNRLILYAMNDSVPRHSYFPNKDGIDLDIFNWSYVKDDTLCYFNEFDKRDRSHKRPINPGAMGNL